MKRHNLDTCKVHKKGKRIDFCFKKENKYGSSKGKAHTTTAWLGSSKRSMQISRAIALYTREKSRL